MNLYEGRFLNFPVSTSSVLPLNSATISAKSKTCTLEDRQIVDIFLFTHN